ncbi:MAG: 4Fe-4S dicluster domain-containing protein [Spirochaetales bacterium]|nr:4Fe-4S dicluster domain-containing protein [Spirochaetales bacterium]
MTGKVIKKADFKRLIEAIRKDNKKVYGPVKNEDSVSLSGLTSTSEIVFDYTMSALPGKRLFFPQTELMFTFQDNQNAPEQRTNSEKPADPEQKELSENGFIVFGLRPCDVLALTYLDKVFANEECIDPYYAARRYNSLIISFACPTMTDTCFCTSINGSPVGSEGSDIMVYDLGESLFFSPVSEAGNDFIEGYSHIFNEPDESEIKKKEDFIAFAMRDAISNTEKIGDSDGSGIEAVNTIQSQVWGSIAERCLGCGVCTYVCPTCHCFAIRDEKMAQKINRIRINDSCMFPGFTSEVSGHNPRNNKSSRMRQRIMHKFDYTVKNFNEIFCVGCGRCIQNCPANVDIREIILTINKLSVFPIIVSS